MAAQTPTDTAALTSDGSSGQRWQKTIDPSTGREYYYDVVTRVTSWEKPADYVRCWFAGSEWCGA